MKLASILSASLLLSAFAVGCASAPEESPSAAEGQDTEASSDALTRAAVKGTYVRNTEAAACNVVRSLELRADGSFSADLSYSGPTVRCALVLSEPLVGKYSVDRSNTITLRSAGARTSFTLRLASSGMLGTIKGGAKERQLFQGSFRKLSANECLSDASCAAGQSCEATIYPMDRQIPAVTNGTCQDRTPSGPRCGGIAGLICPQDTYCEMPEPAYPDAMGTCKPILWACTMEYAPVCGSDGVTYGNDCLASRIPGVVVVHPGPCAPQPSMPRCGGFAGLICPADTFCEMPKNAHPDAMGTCKPVVWPF